MITEVRVVAVELVRCASRPIRPVAPGGLYKQRSVKYRYGTDIAVTGTLSNRVSSRYRRAQPSRAHSGNGR